MKEQIFDQIQLCHQTFCRESGATLRLGIGEYFREAAWARFISAGFKDSDVQLVCRHLKSEIRNGNRYPGSLRFSNLIERLENFEEELQLARGAVRRQPPVAPRERAMNELRPSVTTVTQNTARPVSELIANLRRAAGMTP